MHGRKHTYEHRVKDYITQLKGKPELQVFDLPYGDGITVVRKVASESAPPQEAASARAEARRQRGKSPRRRVSRSRALWVITGTSIPAATVGGSRTTGPSVAISTCPS